MFTTSWLILVQQLMSCHSPLLKRSLHSGARHPRESSNMIELLYHPLVNFKTWSSDYLKTVESTNASTLLLWTYQKHIVYNLVETSLARWMDILLQTGHTCGFHTRENATKSGCYPRGIWSTMLLPLIARMNRWPLQKSCLATASWKQCWGVILDSQFFK